MNFELLDLRAFIAVADLGSFHRAAKALNLSQPALSRRIQKLEESLGAALLERSTRHVALTMVGRDFIPKVRRFLDEFETSVLSIRDLGARSGGLVSIASVPTAVFYFLPRTIGRFSAAYPRIRIRILDVSANEGLEAVARGEADFGINFIGASHPEIDFTPLAEDRFVLACRHDHPLAERSQVTWKELAAHRVITVGRTSGNRALIDNALAQQGQRLRLVLRGHPPVGLARPGGSRARGGRASQTRDPGGRPSPDPHHSAAAAGSLAHHRARAASWRATVPSRGHAILRDAARHLENVKGHGSAEPSAGMPEARVFRIRTDPSRDTKGAPSAAEPD